VCRARPCAPEIQSGLKDRRPLVVGLALLGLAIGLGAVALADGIRDRNRNETITVTGSAKARLLATATKDALGRATVLVEATGGRLGASAT
jgi:hypothetical protein